MAVVKRLKRIPPYQFGLVAGTFYALFSLIIIPFFLIVALVGAFAPKTDSGDDIASGIGIVVMFFFVLLAPVLYGIMGFIFGAIAAWVYNFVAQWTGGIEVEVEDAPLSPLEQVTPQVTPNPPPPAPFR